jgi:hypothetical protein
MEPQCPSPLSQQPANCPYPKPDRSSPMFLLRIVNEEHILDTPVTEKQKHILCNVTCETPYNAPHCNLI